MEDKHLTWSDELRLPLVISGGHSPAIALAIMQAKPVSLEIKKPDPEMSRDSLKFMPREFSWQYETLTYFMF